MSKAETAYKYITWVDYGSEGWKPNGFTTIEEALKCESYGSPMVVTKPVEYQIKEINP